ncbi:hypothetical protein TSOC_007829 [Tetrabaena socialis]|uniref:Uncharacterized protein n=1 Tax=Tetrabaena socialis TaxID=47790 RepID=A0A2J8A030_9CHLO|nr:hypothetical protein TSOC_007829 [Tetrabaena socialis]|eukprot:PNH05869.1 hypothetical protein TSOC_007829 [Tetrabaena socialis]
MVRATADLPEKPQPESRCSARPTPLQAAWQRLGAALPAAGAGCAAWLSLAGAALAAAADSTDGELVNAVQTSGSPLSPADQFSFTSLLLFLAIGYWLAKSSQYFSQNKLDGTDKGKDGEGKGGSKADDFSHAHIRSYVDPASKNGGANATDVRNASLAHSAAFRVTAAVRESQPRIHSLMEEMAGSGAKAPLQRPPAADVDYVAAMVYERISKELAAKESAAAEQVLGPRERAVLETRLLEEVAERCASEQVADFVRLAAQGQLHPAQPAAGKQPAAK